MQEIEVVTKELPYDIREELKLLRVNIQLCGKDKKVILLTSCHENEGKSTISFELARSFAELNKRVLLIDTDLRKSVFSEKLLSGDISNGLTQFLGGNCSANEIIYSVNGLTLDLMPIGNRPPNPAELLSSNRMRKLIEQSREIYDYVIIDTAPLGLVTDAAIVAQYCDGAILLIHSKAVRRRFAKDTLEKLQNTKCPVLGVVLNKVDRKLARYGRYGRYGKYGKYGNYGYGYGYGEESDSES